MKRVITASFEGFKESSSPNYDYYINYSLPRLNKAPLRYGIHYTIPTYGKDMTFYVTEIHPYDDAEYTWAITKGPVVQFIRDRKLVDKMTLPAYEEDEWDDVDEYIQDVIRSVCEELAKMNTDVKQRMVYD